jgi:hypothetical protein
METIHPAYSREHLLLTSYILVTSGVSGGFVSDRMVGFCGNRSVAVRSHDMWSRGVKSKTTYISGDTSDKVFCFCILILMKMNEE